MASRVVNTPVYLFRLSLFYYSSERGLPKSSSGSGLTQKGYGRFWEDITYEDVTEDGEKFTYSYYGQYLHRIVMFELCRISHSLKDLNPKTGLLLYKDIDPKTGRSVVKDMVVHHIDGNPGHNCPQNLMLLEKSIHDWITRDHQKYLKELKQRNQQKQRQPSLFADQEYELEERLAIQNESKITDEDFIGACWDFEDIIYAPPPKVPPPLIIINYPPEPEIPRPTAVINYLPAPVSVQTCQL